MKITDMNMMCLEEICKYLKLEDLLSIADATVRLREAAKYVYHRKFGQKGVEMNSGNCSSRLSVYRDSIQIYDRRCGLRLLRCFGNSIKSLKLSFFRKNQLLFAYVDEYCAESLTKISLSHLGEHLFQQLKKPFIKVQEVEVKNCDISEAGWLKKFFPSVQCLHCDIKSSIEFNNDFLAYHFPHLEHLELGGDTSMKERILSSLRLNPQLKTLSLRTLGLGKQIVLNESDLRNAIEPMQNLEKLKLDHLFISDFNGQIRLKNVKTFDFALSCDEPNLPFLFDELEILNVDILDEVPENFYHFIEHHPNIKELTFRRGQFTEDEWDIEVSEISNALPLLTLITICSYRPSVDDVVRLASGFKSLKKLHLYDVDKYEDEDHYISGLDLYKDLPNRLGNKWQVDIELASVLLERVDRSAGQSK